jgi:hypothetical protein
MSSRYSDPESERDDEGGGTPTEVAAATTSEWERARTIPCNRPARWTDPLTDPPTRALLYDLDAIT